MTEAGAGLGTGAAVAEPPAMAEATDVVRTFGHRAAKPCFKSSILLSSP